MSLKLLQRPSLEPINLEEVKAFLHLEHDLDDSLLSSLISVARELTERFLNRSLITQKWQYKHLLNDCSNSKTFSGNAWKCPFGINVKLALPNAPICEVTNVTCNGLKVREADFKLESCEDREVLSLQIGRYIADYPAEILVEYIAGYGDRADDVPPVIRLGIMMIAARIYKDRELISNEQEIMSGVKPLLCSYRLGQNI